MVWNVGSILQGLLAVRAPILLAIAFFTASLLFLPDQFQNDLGLTSFLLGYRPYLGLMFLGSTCWLLSLAIFGIAPLLSSIFKKHRARLQFTRLLRNLSAEEQAYLVPYIDEGKNTQNFALEDGIIGGLAAKRIVYQGSRAFDLLDGPSWNITPTAQAILKANYEFLEKGRKHAKEIPHASSGRKRIRY